MWDRGWRDAIWANLSHPWDVIVVGGGITGAGILREAARLGLRALLVEQRDFAWGTSSRSSKLVHGGLRYLQQGQVGLIQDSVRERDRLLAEAPGLVEPLGFLIALYKGERPGRWTYTAGLMLYDFLAGQRQYDHFSREDFLLLAPHLAREGLTGGLRYQDAQTDDTRLVLRVLREAVSEGGTALNYARVEGLLREADEVVGVSLRDTESGQVAEVRARVVINATGAWADQLRGEVGAQPAIRPLRGSHLIFPAWRLPVAQAIALSHPEDRRFLFAFPWEGATVVGTTDLDHKDPLNEEPHITPGEVDYLLRAIQARFPALSLSRADIIASYAGVRPVVDSSDVEPSRASREHVVWAEQGLLTVTGGKLTTFRLIAQDALRSVASRLPDLPPMKADARILSPVTLTLPERDQLSAEAQRRLLGRYGADALALVTAAADDELLPIPGTRSLWAELRWAARAEGVCHLEDLLLRRVRVGLLLPEGGANFLPRIRAICQEELGWDDARWASEEANYRATWQYYYRVPVASSAGEEMGHGSGAQRSVGSPRRW